MKIKRTISIATVCVLLVTVFSAVLVYAPPPSDIPSTPFQEVIVANTDPIPVEVTDVSGWTQKTQNNTNFVQYIGGELMETWYINNVQGYREITIYFESWDALEVSLRVSVAFYISGDVGEMYQSPLYSFVYDDWRIVKTFDVIGSDIVLTLYNPVATKGVDDMKIGYYLTT